ncbi:MAG TPA: LptE family protein [Terriglobia bacterium]|nr:LptE family protein [Terriglobia bacterium]
MEPTRPSLLTLSILAAAALLGACGYRVAGRGDRLPPDVKIVAVPVFTNESKQFRIEQKLSASVTRELIERTRYQVTADPEEADAVLDGTVKDVRSGVIAFNLSTGAATALQVVVTADVRLVDRHTHKVLFSNSRYVFREEYEISQSNAQIFEEEGPALNRLAADFARTLVTDILENF